MLSSFFGCYSFNGQNYLVGMCGLGGFLRVKGEVRTYVRMYISLRLRVRYACLAVCLSFFKVKDELCL